MMVYIFDAAKRVRKILSPGSITELVHDEGAYSLSAAISMDAAVKNGEHIGFKCVDGHFRIFTVTKSENFDDAATAYITARDTIVMELMETIVEDLQQLDVQLIPAIEGLLEAAQTQNAWTVTGTQPERLEKSRAYYTDLWTMLETYRTLYEWQIIPYYTFSGGQISGRVIELKEDKAEFRGRILRSKKDASNVYDIKTNPPITRLYVLGKATGTEDEPKNDSIRETVWSVSAGDPVDKPQGQPWIEDPQAVAEYGVHTAVVQINDAQDDKDLIAKGWKHLQTVKKPTSTVTATIQDLEQVPGYENQVIRLGDLVPIRLVNATMEEARVVGIKRDYLHHWLTKLTIGDKEATIQTQVSTLMTNATHTFERLEIFKNRFHEDEALIQLNAEMIQMNAGIIEMNAQEIRANAEMINLKAGKEEVTELGTIITGAMIELDGVKGQIDLKASKAELTETQNRLSQAEIRINGAEASIELKADRTTVDALGTRISQAEIKVDGANEQIDLWAGQLDEFGNRLDGAEVLIDGLNSAITLKADKTTVTNMGTRLTSAEVAIDGLNAEIKLVATEKSVQDLAERVNQAEIQVNGFEAQLKLMATQKTIEDLVERVNQAEINIDGANAMIDQWAGELDEQGKRLNGAEVLIDGLNRQIVLKANSSDVTKLDNRVSQAEVDIDAANAAISLKANQSTVNSLTNRVSQAEVDINAAESAISLKASQSDVTKLTNRVSQAEIKINGATSSIEMLAEQIRLAGYVTMDEFEALQGQVANLQGGLSSFTVVKANTVNANSIVSTYLNATSFQHAGATVSQRAITMGSLTSSGKALTTGAVDLSHSHKVTVNADGTITLGEAATTGGSFRIADTAYYKNGVSAARTEGINSVNLSTMFGSGGVVTARLTNGREGTLQLTQGTASGSNIPIIGNRATVMTVDASSVYNNGYSSGVTIGKNGVAVSSMFGSGGVITARLTNGKEGTLQLTQGTASGKNIPIIGNRGTVMTVNASGIYDAGYTAGEDSVTLSASGWSGNVNTVSASNGKSMTVTRYYRTANTVSSGDTVFVNYNGAMVYATYRSGGSTLTYISSVAVK